MIIDYTPEEKEERDKIIEKFRVKHTRVKKGEREGLSLIKAKQDFNFACQKKRVDKIKGDPELFYKDVEYQIDLVLSRTYENLIRDNMMKSFVRLGFGVYENDEFKFGDEVAVILVKEQLAYHFQVVGKTKRRLDKLYDLIGNAIEKSPYTISQRPQKKELPILLSRQPVDIYKPTDKIYNSLAVSEIQDRLLSDGQYTFLMARNELTGNDVNVILSMSPINKALERADLKQKISAMDLLTMQALYTIYESVNGERPENEKGKPVLTTPNHVWAQMGAKTKLNTTNRKKQEDRLLKMAGLQVDIESSYLLNEYEANGPTGKKVEIKESYKGSLVHLDIKGKGIVDGKEQNCIITIYAPPILLEFSKDLGQITNIPLYVVQATGTLNDDNVAIASYLQREIRYILDGKRNPVINFETLKRETETHKRNKDLDKYIRELLDVYQNPPADKKGNTPTPWIAGYKSVKSGYKIITPAEVKAETPKTTGKKKKPRIAKKS